MRGHAYPNRVLGVALHHGDDSNRERHAGLSQATSRGEGRFHGPDVAAPPGFEPGSADSKSAVLPLHHGATKRLLAGGRREAVRHPSILGVAKTPGKPCGREPSLGSRSVEWQKPNGQPRCAQPEFNLFVTFCYQRLPTCHQRPPTIVHAPFVVETLGRATDLGDATPKAM